VPSPGPGEGETVRRARTLRRAQSSVSMPGFEGASPVNQPIAIQSWCYRHFKSLPEFLTQLKAAGAAAAEVCAVHANFLDPASARSLAEQFKAVGVQLVAVGVERLGEDPAKDRLRFEWCRTAGVRNM